MPDLALEDATLHCEVDGHGPPLLLLAGMLSDSATWAPLMPALSAQFTVIRPDNRTTGRTILPEGPVDCSQMAQDAIALMDHLGIDQFHVGGHSLGGLLSLEVAHQLPERVTSATVMASGRVRSPRILGLFEALLAVRRAPDGEEMWLRALYPWIFGNAFFEHNANIDTALAAALAYPHGQSADHMAQQIAAFGSFRPKAKPNEITCPTLVLYAAEDIMIPPDLARPSFAAITNLTEHTIAKAGHSIMWDAPEEVADHLTRFLADHPINE